MKMVQVGKSLGNAARGFKYVVKNESNFRIQILAGILALSCSFVLNLAFLEKLIIILVILAVLVAEIFNSAIEKICDLLKPRLEERVGLIKDISAAAVFLTSVGALIIGILLFWPHIY